MLKFCPHCGNKLNGGKFCVNCGADLSSYESAGGGIDEAIGNLMGAISEHQTQADRLRTLIIRGKIDEAKELCENLIDQNPTSVEGYLGLIRIASNNFKEYEGEEIDKQISIAEEVCGFTALLSNSDYAKYISDRKSYFGKFEIKDGELIKYNGDDTEVIIPNSVTRIKYCAFDGSKIAKIVTLKNNPNFSSQDGVLYNKAMTEIVFVPKGIDGKVTIPRGVTTIPKVAFYDCKRLTSVEIPNSVTSIEVQAFCGCKSLTNITIPNSVTSIGDNAFESCSSLTSVTIPNSVTNIGESAFSWCESLTSVTIPNSVTSVGHSAFKFCSSLISVTVSKNITSIEDNTFYHCTSLTSVTIPNSVREIKGSAFGGCDKLKSVTIPNSEVWVYCDAFPDDCEIIRR